MHHVSHANGEVGGGRIHKRILRFLPGTSYLTHSLSTFTPDPIQMSCQICRNLLHWSLNFQNFSCMIGPELHLCLYVLEGMNVFSYRVTGMCKEKVV